MIPDIENEAVNAELQATISDEEPYVQDTHRVRDTKSLYLIQETATITITTNNLFRMLQSHFIQ